MSHQLFTRTHAGGYHLRKFRAARALAVSTPERGWHTVQPGGQAAEAVAFLLEIPLVDDCDSDARHSLYPASVTLRYHHRTEQKSEVNFL